MSGNQLITVHRATNPIDRYACGEEQLTWWTRATRCQWPECAGEYIFDEL
jgi:hypothetical protein